MPDGTQPSQSPDNSQVRSGIPVRVLQAGTYVGDMLVAPQYPGDVLPKADIDITCPACDKLLGKRAPGVRGTIELWCRSCKQRRAFFFA